MKDQPKKYRDANGGEVIGSCETCGNIPNHTGVPCPPGKVNLCQPSGKPWKYIFWYAGPGIPGPVTEIVTEEQVEESLREAAKGNMVEILKNMQTSIHSIAQQHGFWEGERNVGEAIALIHSELSEALDFHRNGNGPDDHLPEFDGFTVELADVIIRVLDLAGGMGLPLAEALIAKVQYNAKRPFKHGKKY